MTFGIFTLMMMTLLAFRKFSIICRKCDDFWHFFADAGDSFGIWMFANFQWFVRNGMTFGIFILMLTTLLVFGCANFQWFDFWHFMLMTLLAFWCFCKFVRNLELSSDDGASWVDVAKVCFGKVQQKSALSRCCQSWKWRKNLRNSLSLPSAALSVSASAEV